MEVDDSDFDWLPGYEPEKAAHRAQTCLVVAAPARAVWDHLINARDWPEWFAMSTDVVLPCGKKRLEPGMRFNWSIQGVRFASTIYHFEPFRRLSWRSANPLISTCHIWALDERDGQTAIITDETQRGVLPTLFGFVVRPKLKKGQEVWLNALAARTAQVPMSVRPGVESTVAGRRSDVLPVHLAADARHAEPARSVGRFVSSKDGRSGSS